VARDRNRSVVRRSGVVERPLRVSKGILGTFSFDRNGDTTAGAITIYRILGGEPTIADVITPPPSLVR
jgi:hypothetical protein